MQQCSFMRVFCLALVFMLKAASDDTICIVVSCLLFCTSYRPFSLMHILFFE